MGTVHKSVMLKEVIGGLNLKSGDVIVDATLGGGGHSLEILKNILPNGKLIAIDRDIEAIERFKSKIKKENLDIKDENLILINDNFSNIKNILEEIGVERVNAVLADFGLSSDQLDDNERGFSFNSEAWLDMRMDRNQELNAYQVVNEYEKNKLVEVIRNFGEEKFATKIVSKIIETREEKKIETVKELVELILEAVPERYKHQKIHPATRTLQAIRMEVNKELESIGNFLSDVAYKVLPGGRIVVISFHSGEDRLVKNIFKEMSVDCVCPPDFPVCNCGHRAILKIVTKKPIVANEEELRGNPRARSAKTRIAEKI